MVMGLSMIIAPFDVTMKNVIDSLCVLAASIICYVLQQQEKKKIGRAEGMVFILSYAVYLTYIIARDVI